MDEPPAAAGPDFAADRRHAVYHPDSGNLRPVDSTACIGQTPALVALVMYGMLPVLHNTYAGLRDVDPAVRQAARGMGADARQMLLLVELPLALPKIVAGVRTMVVMNISVSTFAVFIGAGGLGAIILQGIRTFHDGMLLAGTLLTALLAMTAEQLLKWLERKVG